MQLQYQFLIIFGFSNAFSLSIPRVIWNHMKLLKKTSTINFITQATFLEFSRGLVLYIYIYIFHTYPIYNINFIIHFLLPFLKTHSLSSHSHCHLSPSPFFLISLTSVRTEDSKMPPSHLTPTYSRSCSAQVFPTPKKG